MSTIGDFPGPRVAPLSRSGHRPVAAPIFIEPRTRRRLGRPTPRHGTAVLLAATAIGVWLGVSAPNTSPVAPQAVAPPGASSTPTTSVTPATAVPAQAQTRTPAPTVAPRLPAPTGTPPAPLPTIVLRPLVPPAPLPAPANLRRGRR